MKRKSITILFPEKRDLTTIREKTADIVRLTRSKTANTIASISSFIAPPDKVS